MNLPAKSLLDEEKRKGELCCLHLQEAINYFWLGMQARVYVWKLHRPLKKMFLDISSKVARGIGVECGCWVEAQRMTEAHSKVFW